MAARVLLVNPWIYDFAAYDFWVKPIGLLQLGAILQQLGYGVELLDCLDRKDPDLGTFDPKNITKSKVDGSGHFLRVEIEKPDILRHIPRKYCRYGFPPELVRQRLERMARPEVILLTSGMTYWYPGVVAMTQLLRRYFPKTPIILGGIYATLCPDHAGRHVAPDFLIAGEGERSAIQLVASLSGGKGRNFDYQSLDDLPFPAMDLYPKLESIALLTSRGCPNCCSFCAAKRMAPEYRRRTPHHVIEEIGHWHMNHGVGHFAFFDDALLHQSDDYFKPMLREIAIRGWRFKMHFPNGLQPRHIDAELAKLFFQTGCETIRLSFETVNPERQQAMSAKVTAIELERALNHLVQAGFQRHRVAVYVLMGLPDQDYDEVAQSVQYVVRLGTRVSLASYSPIPGTVDYDRAVASGLWDDADPVLSNSTIFPMWSKIYGYQRCAELVSWAKEMNQNVLYQSINERRAPSDEIAHHFAM